MSTSPVRAIPAALAARTSPRTLASGTTSSAQLSPTSPKLRTLDEAPTDAELAQSSPVFDDNDSTDAAPVANLPAVAAAGAAEDESPAEPKAPEQTLGSSSPPLEPPTSVGNAAPPPTEARDIEPAAESAAAPADAPISASEQPSESSAAEVLPASSSAETSEAVGEHAEDDASPSSLLLDVTTDAPGDGEQTSSAEPADADVEAAQAAAPVAAEAEHVES
jgi:hypothetical protein